MVGPILIEKSMNIIGLCRKSSLILANSHASKALLVEKFKLDQNKIQVIHNGFLSKDFFIDPFNYDKKSIGQFLHLLNRVTFWQPSPFTMPKIIICST